MIKKDTAITCYIDNNPNIINEFGWLYKSWLYSGSWLVSDIIAYHHPDIQAWQLPEDQGIRYISSVPHREKHPEWAEYPFINSLGYLSEPEAGVLAVYKYILRTDCDCFLTPYFKDLRPRLATFGAGQFSEDPAVVIKLAEIAKRWNIYPVFNNVGSTVMGYSNRILMYSQIQLELCRKLQKEEFQDGPGEWPGWFVGVLSMYAGQLAANLYFGLAMNLGGLDVHCVAREEISPSDYHIHAWHSFEHFSKFNWRDGKYQTFEMDQLDRNKIADYCLWIAGPGPV